MRILLDGYFDRNLGDDLMLTIAAQGLKEHELYVPSDRIKIENVTYTTSKSGFDVYLKVTGSGFLIHNNSGIFYRLRDICRERRYAPKRAVIGCNISKPISAAAELAILKQLKSYDFITVRDNYSKKYINNMIKDADCEKYPDIVFSLPDNMIPSVPCERALGIAVHNSADYEKIAHIADGYIEKTGNSVLLLCFDMGIENDEFNAESVRELSKNKDKIEIIPYDSIPDMLSQMMRCGVILGIRLHSIILAARMGIPFVPMAYSVKAINTLDEMNYNGAVYNAESFACEGVLECVLNPPSYELSKRLVEDSKNHIEKLKAYLKRQE